MLSILGRLAGYYYREGVTGMAVMETFGWSVTGARLRGSKRVGAVLVLLTLTAGVSGLMLPAVSARAADPPPPDGLTTLIDALVGGPATTVTTGPPLARVAQGPPSVPPSVPPTAGQTSPPSGNARCAAARSDVEAGGLSLPASFEFRCPGNTQMFAGDRQHWGVACSHASLCPDSAYVAINPEVIGSSEARLRHVIAHETCHAIDSVSGRPMSEGAADACAAAHGFPRQ